MASRSLCGQLGRVGGVAARWRWAALTLAISGLVGCEPPPPRARPQPAPLAADDAAPGDAVEPAPVEPVRSPTEPAPPAAAATRGAQLYARHCAACHGAEGDGRGLAATFVFPKPRDLQAGRFRLVSTGNNVPTREDLHAVLLRGMPGSSMPPWGHLPQADRDALVDEVMRLRAAGARAKYIAVLREEEELSEEELADPDVQAEIEEYVSRLTTPGEASAVPEFAAPEEAALARGREVYAKFACIQCHGETGRGDGVQKMVDDEGYPTGPRDFTAGIFKGGHDAASLYRRIAYGMPGTPMPGSKQMTPEQMADLVHFVRSLSTEEQRNAAVLQREAIRAARVAALPKGLAEPAGVDDPVWSAAAAVSVRMTPLWWRNGADPGLTVQALHDGQVLAVRLSWSDATQNASAVRPDEFEDLAAVQWSRAGEEPFLGMGSAETPIELWQWRAGLQADGAEDQLMDEYPFDTEEYRQRAGGAPLPDFVTARAAGNPLAIREGTGSDLVAGGPGSVTFRPQASRAVAAGASWREGRWSVVLVRPLAAATEGGLPLAGGTTYAAAFAVWDGAARDRGGQKVISIWHDLELE